MQIKSVKDLIDDAKKIATPEVTSEGKSKQKLNKEDKQMKDQIKQVQKPSSIGKQCDWSCSRGEGFAMTFMFHSFCL